MHAKLLQLYLTLCNPMDCSPPSSSVHGILQAKILEWVVISSSRRSSQPRDWTWVSCGSCITGGFFIAECISIYLYLSHSFLPVHPSVDVEAVPKSWLLWINDAVNMRVKTSLWDLISFPFNIYPEVGLLDYKIVLFFIFLRKLHAVFHNV